MTGLLHTAEEDHLERRKNRLDALLERPFRMGEHRRDRRAVRLLVEALEHGCELAVDLGTRRVRDLPPRRIVLEVDRTLGEPVEPAAERVSLDVPEPEHATEAEHRDGLEVLAHQLGVAATLEAVEQLRDERLDELRRRRLYDSRAKRGIEHPAQALLPLAVERAGCSRRPSSA